jgi:hypothetical protein
MRISIYIHQEDLENLNKALNNQEEGTILDSVRRFHIISENYIEISLSYNEYVKCIDLEIFEQLLSL